MKFEKFNKICVIGLVIIILLQVLFLIFGINIVVGIVNWGLSDILSIIFWIVLAVNIGAVVDYKYLEK